MAPGGAGGCAAPEGVTMEHLVANLLAAVAGVAVAAGGIYSWTKTIRAWQGARDPAIGEPIWLIVGPLLTLLCLGLLARIAYGLLF